MIEKEIGRKIKLLRKKNFTSVAELSAMFSKANYPVSIKTIYKWESGNIIPDIDILIKLTYFFNTSLSYFIDNYKKCQALTDSELEFLTTLRVNQTYRKIITLLAKNKKEEEKFEHRTR